MLTAQNTETLKAEKLKPACGHEGIATALLRDMFDKNLKLAPRMMDIGDFNSAEMILQSAITQVRQIAGYQPKHQTPNTKLQIPNTKLQTPNTKHQDAIEV